ncbi:hypothetical protein GBAR_LOCUS25026 [Geodia barretti]|uniref:Uncharacterized protein n=1 Tax=Geodia barretti TaxID=519541 RepID=A0AA35TC64_GEOBA|nr:hypothetical protein GBAR_LOCUS25026 [Geodia barretti]
MCHSPDWDPIPPVSLPVDTNPHLSHTVWTFLCNCSISTISDRGSSLPASLYIPTNESAPSGSPEMLSAVPGERERLCSPGLLHL